MTREAYLMESPAEGRRLETKTLRGSTIRQLRWAGLRTGMRCLDVGCGTGAVTRLMAEISGPARAMGIDRSATRIEEARRIASDAGCDVRFRAASAERLPLEDDRFDLCWSRFLFEYLPDPRAALREMIRVTRPGGLVTVGDLDAQLECFDGLTPQARELLSEIHEELARSGFDRHVGRRLYGWLRAEGLEEIRVRVEPHQVFAGGLPERERANWRQKLEVIVPRMIGRGGEAERWRRASRVLRDELERPELFYYSTAVLVRGRVPRIARERA